MPEDALSLRVKALISFRAVFVTLLLGASFLFRIDYFYDQPQSLSYLIVCLYSLTIVYSLLLGKVRNIVLFTYVQLLIDVIAEIALISMTGGVESWFSFILILTVLSSSIVLNRTAGYIIASVSGILYGALLDLQYYGVLPIAHEIVTREGEFLYNIFVHILSLYVTAYLGGYLSASLEKASQTIEERDTHLKELELFNTKVIESLPSGLFTSDRDGNVLVFNRAAEEITGVGKDRVIGGSISEALPFLAFPFREGRREELMPTENGEGKILGMTVSGLKDAGGQETGFIGIFQDLTPFKALEAEIKQKEKWAAIGELSANIAHEIRNPLASMRGSIEMIRDDRIPLKHKEKLMGIALKEMERLDNIITDFLTYSRPRPIEPRRVDLHLLLDETLSLLKNAEQNMGNIGIRRDFEGPLYARVDPQKIRQVFWNLGINAIESMKDGGELVVSAKKGEKSVSISFSDTGPGIPPSQTEKIFYPFFTTKDEGTGLGLSIAYRIIEEHRGRLSVKSVPGIKTVFEIILNAEDGKPEDGKLQG
ncbi:MAG: ATP-binding protein [Nitrospiraceae bacterium]|nr:ATP-binding protein [Nitrospiraceae bacterium]